MLDLTKALVAEWAYPHSQSPKSSGKPCEKSGGWCSSKVGTNSILMLTILEMGCSTKTSHCDGQVCMYFWPYSVSLKTGRIRVLLVWYYRQPYFLPYGSTWSTCCICHNVQKQVLLTPLCHKVKRFQCKVSCSMSISGHFSCHKVDQFGFFWTQCLFSILNRKIAQWYEGDAFLLQTVDTCRFPSDNTEWHAP